MPIYEYKCSLCGFDKEYIQKMDETPLTKCPECGNETFKKQVSSGSFTLKGNGWYKRGHS